MNMNDRSPQLDHLDAVERYLSRLEVMVCERTASAAFFDELSQGLIQICGAMSVGVWMIEDNRPQCLLASPGYQATLPEPWQGQAFTSQATPKSEVLVVESPPDGSSLTRIISSRQINDRSNVSLDIWRGCSNVKLSSAQLREIVEGVTDLAANFSLRFRLDELTTRISQEKSLNRVLSWALQPVSLEEKCQILATTLVDSLEMDRVSVFQITAAGSRVLALSPAAHFNGRSSQLTQLRKLAADVHSAGGWLMVRVGEGIEGTPQLEPSTEQYLQTSLSREIWAMGTCLRLRDPGLPTDTTEGVIVLERFTLQEDGTPVPRQAYLSNVAADRNLDAQEEKVRHSEALLAYALDSLAQQLSVRAQLALKIADLWRASGFRQRFQFLGIAALLAMLVFFVVPARLRFTVEGSLQPKSLRNIFATRDGVVEELYVQHGEQVTQEQPLLKIRSPELELELFQLTGQAETLEAKLLSLRSAKLKRASDRTSENSLRLSAEEEDIKIQLLGIRKQVDIVTADRESLTLLSPFRGQVDGWNMEQQLERRPVFHGQKLIQVFRPEDGWQLELSIPDDSAGYVLAAQRKKPCKVDFRIRSDASKLYRSQLSSISQTTQVNAAQQAVVSAKVDLSEQPIEVTRAGAVVVAQIDCGLSTLGLIWLREIREFLQRSFWI